MMHMVSLIWWHKAITCSSRTINWFHQKKFLSKYMYFDITITWDEIHPECQTSITICNICRIWISSTIISIISYYLQNAYSIIIWNNKSPEYEDSCITLNCMFALFNHKQLQKPFITWSCGLYNQVMYLQHGEVPRIGLITKMENINKDMSMATCKTAVTPLLTHWRY